MTKDATSPQKLKARFRVTEGPHTRDLVFVGQTCRALQSLILAGQKGVTAQELSSWALRLAHYVLELRKVGLNIEMIREAHAGGWHGRYVLHSDVRLLRYIEDNPEGGERAAA